ncbi:hypothetical protein JHS3_18390 [Jeongeupia sp. HS-3]|uniref:hypothetical protein n=1 Tax=Jeongeupia sp. HS-3 TaxID=1009682 RepID=UPI0018A60F8D|nr:hypothetical protein [Jeongeupia sp. HS-3]BCL76103.1 hypothetical protein JHS3_18390 [Jeongeupia sp. HS-3]
MAFYFRADDVPELRGLSKWDQRVLLRGTFLKERAISTLLLLVLVIGSIQFVINPMLESFSPGFQHNTLAYAGVLIVWLLALMSARDIVMMNILRPKIAAKRVEQQAAELAAVKAANEGDAAE